MSAQTEDKFCQLHCEKNIVNLKSPPPKKKKIYIYIYMYNNNNNILKNPLLK